MLVQRAQRALSIRVSPRMRRTEAVVDKPITEAEVVALLEATH